MAQKKLRHGNLRHGFYGTKTYRSWSEMKYRCNKVGKKYWHDMGITYDPRWEKFENFLSDMGERPANKELDRIDGTKNYCLENCRWATEKEQQSNRNNKRLFEYNGEKKSLTDWALKLGVKRSKLAQRFYVYGWSVNRTLSEL